MGQFRSPFDPNMRFGFSLQNKALGMKTGVTKEFRPTACGICHHRNKFGRSRCSSCGSPLPAWNKSGFWLVGLAVLAVIIVAL
jgi:hypothetical protein